ncbi:potassium channel family protein [Erythrobacter sp. GH1-10]|uniref:potassium channel family protein n=1 Tax=Erythrobacter sp. GH1-10 TaxID=3349334 RepID=UPI003877B11B
MNQVFAGTVISILLVAASLSIHSRVLRATSGYVESPHPLLPRPMITVMTVIFLIHMLEIALFAMAFYAMGATGLGELTGAYSSTPTDYFYFSIATYSTLGIGDITPSGAIRMVAGVEALAGLLLIAWSASFTYLMMERLWANDHDKG